MLVLFLLFTMFRRLQGSPLTAADSVPTAHILPRADVVFGTRTTSDIVISCLATLFACTWTAMHLDIPLPLDSRWSIFTRRFFTTFYALLGPEFVSLLAFRQLVCAEMIMKEYNTEIVQRAHTYILEKISYR